MFGTEKLAKTIGGMSVPGMITVVILSAFALAAFAIWVVAGISRVPHP
jgi:hypothetical protein